MGCIHVVERVPWRRYAVLLQRETWKYVAATSWVIMYIHLMALSEEHVAVMYPTAQPHTDTFAEEKHTLPSCHHRPRCCLWVFIRRQADLVNVREWLVCSAMGKWELAHPCDLILFILLHVVCLVISNLSQLTSLNLLTSLSLFSSRRKYCAQPL